MFDPLTLFGGLLRIRYIAIAVPNANIPVYRDKWRSGQFEGGQCVICLMTACFQSDTEADTEGSPNSLVPESGSHFETKHDEHFMGVRRTLGLQGSLGQNNQIACAHGSQSTKSVGLI